MDILKKGCSSLRTWKERKARLHRVLASLASKRLLAGGSGASEADASTSGSPRALPVLPPYPAIPSVEAAVLSFSVPSEQAEEGWWGGRSACQEVGGIVVEKLAWTPAVKREQAGGRAGQVKSGEAGAQGPHPRQLSRPSIMAPPLLNQILPPSLRHQEMQMSLTPVIQHPPAFFFL